MSDKSKVREAILSTATALFGRHGYDKTSIDEIARQAGKAKTSIYYHFDSKLSIFRACIEGEFNRLRERLDVVRGEYAENNAKCFSEYLMARMEVFPEMKVYKTYICELFTDVYRGELKDAAEAARAGFDEYEYRFFADTVREAREAGVFTDKVLPDPFAKMMIALLKGLEIQFFLSGNEEEMRTTYESLVEYLILDRVPVNTMKK